MWLTRALNRVREPMLKTAKNRTTQKQQKNKNDQRNISNEAYIALVVCEVYS